MVLLMQTPLLPKAFEGWTRVGDARVVEGSLVLGPSRGAVRRYDVPGLRVLYFGAKVNPSPGAKDLLTDPMHPDDFLSRWVAQGMVATLTKP